MPALKAPKAEPATVYVALQGFVYRSPSTGRDELIQDGIRLRGDHEAVVAYPQNFIDANVDDLTLHAAQHALVTRALAGKDTHR